MHKTISINPALFRVGGGGKKTRRAKGAPKDPSSSSGGGAALKLKMMNLINHHKNKEKEKDREKEREARRSILAVPASTSSSTSLTASANEPASGGRDSGRDSGRPTRTLYAPRAGASVATDSALPQPELSEFAESMQYLKGMVEATRKRQVAAKTVRNPASFLPKTPEVHLDLPRELDLSPLFPPQSPLPSPPLPSPSHSHSLASTGTAAAGTAPATASASAPATASAPPAMRLIPNSEVPYGALKGGAKPCYREWARTQRRGAGSSSGPVWQQHPPQPPLKPKPKHRARRVKEPPKHMSDAYLAELAAAGHTEIVGTGISAGAISTGATAPPNTRSTKHTIKKITTRTYTLGKSPLKRVVRVLVKDNQTRKRVLEAHRDLRAQPVSDIKKYLRDHNLIKAGTSAPDDMLRKMYESAMLAGDVTNSNPVILLHNFTA